MKPATIRLARKSEVLAVKKLVDTTKELDVQNETFPRTFFSRVQKSGILFVATRNSRIIGCCFGTWNVKEKWADMLGLVVEKKERKNGVGRKLVHAFEEKAHTQGIRTIDLFAHHTVKGLFPKLGYTAGETYVAFRKKLRKSQSTSSRF
jgi:N-acetylglutamate synthase-like GNAT family acetyltransferase